jgi:hypothetical protein
MADLGNLYFDILFRDKTAEQRKKIKADILKDLDVKLDLKVGVSKTDLIKSAREALAEKEFKVGVSVDHSDVSKKVQAAFDGKTFKIGIESRKSDLAKSIRESLKGEAFKVGVIIDKASASQAVQEALRKAGLNTNYSASDLRATRARAVEAKAEAYINSQRELARQRAAAAAKAELGLATARERSANAARAHASATLNMNGAMRSQLSITGELANQMLGLYSIYTLERFIRGLVDIGGEFEQQELALSAMLNDAGKAHEIFGSIKNLAVVSPFGVRELNDYTKQLKAFSIPYNELYETTKRLADISAGVGVDMGRIILAYGQVRSAAFLRGQELRQFTEAGIPMVEALADKFSKLENRVISAGEVIDMISKKKVSFEDVKDVLWGMTDDGGKFHNMQEVLSESLSAKWKNLGDAIDIMMADMAESMNGTLKGTAEILTELTSNWQSLVPVIEAAVIAFGSQRVATFAINRAMGQENVLLIKSALALKQKAASNLIVAQSYRTLNAAEKGVIASSKTMSTSDWKLLASSGQLTKEYALRLMALGKLKSGQAGHIAQLLGITKAEMKAALSTSRYTVMMYSLGAGIRSVGLALKSLVWNPYTAIFAGLALVMSGWQKMEQKSEDMKQRIEELSQTAQEGYKNLEKQLQKFNGIDTVQLNGDGLITAIKEIKEVLKDYTPDVNNIFKEADSIEDLAERYIFLRNALLDAKEAYKILNDIRSVGETANEATDGWFDDSLVENIEDYLDALADANKELIGIGKYRIEISNAIQEAAKGDAKFAKAIDGKALEDQIRIMTVYKNAWINVSSSLNKSSLSASKALAAFAYENAHAMSVLNNDVLPDLKTYADSVRNQLEAKGWDFSNLTKAQVESLRMLINDMLGKIKGMTPEIERMLGTQILTVEYQIEPVIVGYTEKVLYGSLAGKIKKFQEELAIKPGGMVKGKPIQMFTDKEFETMTSDEKIVEALDDKVKEAALAVKAAERIKNNTDAINEAQAVYDFYKAIRENFLNKGDKDDFGKDLGKKDLALEALKERFKQVKDFISMYEKLSDTYGKAEALFRTKQSGLFAADLFKGSTVESISVDARKEVEKILKESGDKTKDRRSLTESAYTYNIDLAAKVDKESLQKSISEIEKFVSDTTKKWNIYQQLLNAGASKKEASIYAFGAVTDYEKKSEELRDSLQKKMEEKGIYVPFTFTEQEATEALGGKEGVLYKQFFKAWKEAKDSIEKDSLEIKLKEVTAINKYKSIAEKIRDLSEKYAPLTGGFIGDGGELFGNEDGMSPGQKALFTEYKEEVAKLKGQLLELLPVWEQIFGDQTYKSYGQIQQASTTAQQIVDNAKITKNKDGKPVAYTSWYNDSDGNRVDVSGQYSQIEKLKKAIHDLYKEGLNKNPFATLAKNIKDLFSNDADDDRDLSEKLAAVGESAAESAQLVGTFAGQMSDMFDALGNEGAADSMGNVQDAMTSISNIGQGFAKGGIVGGIAAAAGEAVNWIGKIAQAHDKKLDKAIEKSKERVQHLKNVYEQIDAILEKTLGSGTELKLIDAENDKVRLNQLNGQIDAIRNKGKINIFDMMSLSKYAAESAKLQKRVKAYNEGGAYGYQRALMQEQLSEVEQQRRDELDKKKTDDSKVEDYNNQIAELKQQIKDFAEDAADSLYGINLKDWASQLGDALYEAWQKGEDGAEAFKKKAAEIMGDVMNSVLKLAILEPAMKNLQTMLFGEDGMSGMFGSDFSLDDSELESIADYLMGVSSKTDDYYDALDKLNEYMEKKYGVSMKEEAESSGLSKGIEGVTEDTANLLASYINAIRADVAAKLILVRQLIEEYYPQMNMIAQAQLTELKTIAKNTADNVALVTEIRDMLSGARIDKNRGFYLK